MEDQTFSKDYKEANANHRHIQTTPPIKPLDPNRNMLEVETGSGLSNESVDLV